MLYIWNMIANGPFAIASLCNSAYSALRLATSGSSSATSTFSFNSFDWKPVRQTGIWVSLASGRLSGL